MEQRWKSILLYVVLIICSFLPLFTVIPYAPWDRGLVMFELFMTTSLSYPLWLRVVLHILTLVLVLLLIVYGQRLGRFVSAYFGVLFVFYAVTQNIALLPTYGLTILLGNLVLLAILGVFWFWEAFRPQNEYVFHRLPWWRYWPIPFLVLAFWFPYGAGLLPDFNPLLLLASDFGVTFCATAPLVIALLTWSYPRVNRRLYYVTCFLGALIGIFNLLAPITMPGYTLWMLFLHTPLIFISFYGLILPRLSSESAA
ncbi:MAG: hypothetical protein Q6364_02270 [Candidatus Hermodarchaeota archaeon]|nr:hypothetical protein [Candidatus Hermodarchaeota archaeon]